MPHNRYYIDSPLEKGATLSIEGEEWHHLTRVLRARVGDHVELVNGHGILAGAHVVELNKRDAGLSIQEVSSYESPPPPLILAQAIPRMNHLEWIIEKGTELNATSFWLFPGNLSEKDSFSQTQMARLKHLAVSAMKQCGRLDLPKIKILPPLAKWVPQEGTLLFGDTAESAPYLWDLKATSPFKSPVILFIGPEKGFDSKERSFLLEQLHAKGVRLHKNILRAETAPLAALSLIQRFL
ncbi:MAG: 16S rRNA (uracil(1498)-N(3))-methyltransferase [Verrucomicrobia bacterium]|nr:16S rRNA (uracil(1498)-N(3))-methyltransferase [Verrucomicrobiota bacterium]